MIEILAARKRELEKELQERIEGFFESYDKTPESVSINMKLTDLGQEGNLPAIHIRIKDASN